MFQTDRHQHTYSHYYQFGTIQSVTLFTLLIHTPYLHSSLVSIADNECSLLITEVGKQPDLYNKEVNNVTTSM